MNLTKEKLQLIEDSGVFFTEQGLKPSTARIAALLLISDRVELTFDEIRETLNLSKSATSNGINTLLITRKIEYIRKPGDRKRYFRSKIENWEQSFLESFDFLIRFSTLLEKIREVRSSETKEFNKALGNLIGFMKHIEKEITGIYEKWQQERDKTE